MSSRFGYLLPVCAALLASSLAKAQVQEASLRRPVAMAVDENDEHLFVANRQSGTVSIIDSRCERVIAECKIGTRLSDLALLRGRLLATDEAEGHLLICDFAGTNIVVREEVNAGTAPVTIALSQDGSICFVASLWERSVAVVELIPKPAVAATIRLPFAPRGQLLVGKKLIVTDSFGGQIAVVDAERRKLESVRQLPAHNIRGLALTSDRTRLYLLHQKLSALAQTTSDDIRWGNLLANDLRSLRLSNVLDSKADLLVGAAVHSLGELENGFADPSAIVVTSGQRVFIGSSGTGQILHAAEADWEFSRLNAGQRLTSFCLSRDQKRLYAADAAADEILVIHAISAKLVDRIPLGGRRQKTAAETGEDLFYSGRLSHKGWLSCHSCHTDGHSNELLSDTLGDGNFGAPKRVLSLLGTGDTGPWGWTGNQPTLESQVHKSIATTMRGKAAEDQVASLAVYLHSLKPPPAHLDSNQPSAIARGQTIFRKHGCAKCHEPPTYTSSRSYEVALADENGVTQFNPPSLRGISQRAAFLHDNRARSLNAVFTVVRHGVSDPLADNELSDLLAFLATL